MLTQMAYNRQMPILGICRGIQTLAMALGGRVWQDINEKTVTKHSQEAARSEVTHSVNIEGDSLLHQMYQEDKMYVNSFHHQAVRETGPKFRVTAKSPDNIIEAMESNEFKPIVGVQWHPECLEEGMPLFHWLIRRRWPITTPIRCTTVCSPSTPTATPPCSSRKASTSTSAIPRSSSICTR